MQRRLGPDSDPFVRQRLLLTGFGPFPGIPINASAVLVEEIAKRLLRRRNPVDLRIAILPTEWQEGPAEVQRHIMAFRPDIALHFGVASGITGFRIETLAENARNRLADACGHVPRRRAISASSPQHLLSTFPADKIRQRLDELALPVEMSTDAGQYLCNATLFRSLSLTRKAKGARMAGFIHIPSTLGDPEQAQSLQGFDWPRAIAGGLAIVETCLAHAAEPTGSPA
jgi:pyroglutamyl-peptidase